MADHNDAIERAAKELSKFGPGSIGHARVMTILRDLVAESVRETEVRNGFQTDIIRGQRERLARIVEWCEEECRRPITDNDNQIACVAAFTVAQTILAIAREGGGQASPQADTAGALHNEEPRQPAAPDLRELRELYERMFRWSRGERTHQETGLVIVAEACEILRLLLDRIEGGGECSDS